MECGNKNAVRFCDPDSNRVTSRLVTKTGAGALPLSYAKRDRIRLNSVFGKFFTAKLVMVLYYPPGCGQFASGGNGSHAFQSLVHDVLNIILT